MRVNTGNFMHRWYVRKLGERTLRGQLVRKFRRFIFGTFRQEYVSRAIAETREGECRRCGSCCALVYRCPFLSRDEEGLPGCRIYGQVRPTNCKVYPFDHLDSEIDGCGFRFRPMGPAR